jgi:hypothetical protein
MISLSKFIIVLEFSIEGETMIVGVVVVVVAVVVYWNTKKQYCSQEPIEK